MGGIWLLNSDIFVLIAVSALRTDFTDATLTGACIEDWNINSRTILEGVTCKYVYLKYSKQERCPVKGIFKPGDLARLFEQAQNTFDLIFREGLDWQAFAYSFKRIEIEYAGAQIEVQAIEFKAGGVVVVKLRTAPDADKSQIYSQLMQSYEVAIKALQSKTDEDAQHIKRDAQTISQLLRIIESQGEVQKAMADNPKVKMEIGTVHGGVAGSVEGHEVVYISEQQKSLAEAAQEIQQLLDQLSETYSLTEVPAKAEAAIQGNPQLKG